MNSPLTIRTLITFLLLTSCFFSTNFHNSSFAQDNQERILTPEESEGITIDKADPSRFYAVATLQILNKTTAKTILSDLKIGEKINLNNLKIIAHKCWQAPLEQRPESKILLEVFEVKDDAEQPIEKRVFYGWIFASSPSISGLEHPIYDITAIGCKNK